jgi:hypothetical protein
MRMNGYLLRQGSLHDYEVGEPERKYAIATIHVNTIMYINIIFHRCMLTDSDGKYMVGLLHQKKEKGVTCKS